MRGVRNLGDTCYLSAVLQCLAHAPQLTNYVLAPGCAGEDAQKKRANACAALAEYAALVRAYWSRDAAAGGDAAVDPTGLRAALLKLHRGAFRPGAPQDAHEALLALLKTLHDALARTKPVAGSVAAPRVDRAAWDAHNAGNYSMLTEIFQAQLATRVEGPGGFAAAAHDHPWDLVLPIDEATSVQQALARYLAPARVDGYRLPDGSAAAVTVRRALVYLPLVLVLCLSRFGAGGAKKLDKFVDYGVELDAAVGGGVRYKLFGVVLHAGGAADGHYSALVRHREAWAWANDEAVTPVADLNALIQRDAYLLFYARDLAASPPRDAA